MSYLDLPRIHFGGLFFTGPNTIGNITPNYEASTKLEGANNQYIPQVAGWNALGVAQWWLEECTVLSAVGPDGAAVTSGDPLIGGTVQSPSPSTPLQDGSGAALGIAKMVDLDPDQQGRSALFGVNLFVTLPNGAGFWGALSVAELRQLNARVPVGGTGSWSAVGTWMGVLQNVTWTGDISSSPLLVALKAASGLGISVRFTADLHQNNPKNLLTPGDLFCYGRMMGSFGPTQANELAQVLPGRQLAMPPAPPTPPAPNAAVMLRKTPARVAVVATAAAMAAPAPPAPSPMANPGFALTRTNQSGTLLHVAHRAMESITLDREAMHLKDELMPRYAKMIYTGYWFAPEREMLQAAIDQTQEWVNGVVRLKLFKGSASVAGRKSPNSLYRMDYVTFEEDSVYNQFDAEGFIKLNALRLRLGAMAHGKK